ncbi:T9SS sorting signal type C domain-containing protein [Flavobacterium sp. SM2513]|uniref:T9SS sorting signal type C domain-containing protein n=1 Tax=Flavobacterium sp. SM2513 TaxID=3424766 RepID=UPI003D7F31A2
MDTFLPTKRGIRSSAKKMSASFLRLAYGSIFALLLLMSGGVFGQGTITITQSSSGITATGYDSGAERTWTQSGVSFGAKAVFKESGQARLQMQASNGVLYNTTALPGKILSVTINQTNGNTSTFSGGNTSRLVNATTGSYTVTGGTTVGSASSTGWTSSDFTGTDYTFFAIKRGSGAAYWTSVVITYETGKTVTFDANTGTGTMSNQTASTATALTTNTFTKTNNVFAGWNTVAVGGGTAYADGASYPFTADATLYAQWTPVTTTLAYNGSTVAAADITQGTNNNILASFTLAQAGGNANLTEASFLFDGTFVAADINGAGLKLYTSTTNSFGSASVLASATPTATGSGEIITYTGLSQTLTAGATRYFWLTANLAVTATVGHTINMYSMAAADFITSTGTKSGTAAVSGTQSIIATAVPTITVTPGTLTDYGSVCLNTDSTLKSYDVVGVNLTNNVIVTAPSGFKVRKGADAYATTATLVPDGSGNVSIAVDVIYSPTVAGASGTLTITNASTGAVTKNVSVSGTGINTPATIATPTSTAVTTTTATLGGNISSIGCSAVTERGIYWSTTNGFADGAGTKVSTTGSFGTGVFTQAVTSLTSGTTIYFKAFALNSGGTVYTSQSSFTTLKAEPTNHPTLFACGTTTTTTIPLTWTDATGATVPDGYLIKWGTSYGAITAPVDGTVQGDASGIKNIANGIGTYTVTGLTSGTAYFFKIWSYTNSGSAIDYKLTGEAQTTCTTVSGPCHTEDFSGIGTIASYSSASWTGAGGTWNVTDARGDQTITGNAITIRSGVLTSPTFSDGVGNITLTTKFPFSESSGNLVIAVNGTTVGTVLYSEMSGSTPITKTFTGINVGGTVVITATSSGARYTIDDLNWTCYVDCVAPTVVLSGTPVTFTTATSVILNGNVTAAGGFAINTRGFEYSTNSAMTGSATKSTAATATGTYSENLTSLVANTVYYYRGYAVNDCSPNKTGYTATSSYPTFTTLHNAPTVGTGSASAATSFTANWTAPTGGAAAFTYQIQVDNDSGFGSVDFTASGITGLSVSATGLSSSTTYYYRVRAVNAGGNSAWSSTSVGYATAAPDPVITYAVLQFPGTADLYEGNTVTVYGRVYAETVTEGPGGSGMITAEVGYNATNTNPNTWVNWTTATWNAQYGNNDEYNASIGTGLTPGTYYYAVRFKLGTGAYVYGGTAGNWYSTGNNGVLTINSNLVDWANYQSPVSGTFTLGGAYNVYGQVYEPGITNAGSPGAGITAEAGYSTLDTNPSTWSNWVATTFNTDIGNNDEYTANIGPSITTAGVYYLAFRYKKTGSTEYVYGGKNGIWSSDNATVTVVSPQEINIKQGVVSIASGGTFDHGNQITSTSGTAVTFTVENTGGVALTVGALTKTGTDAGQFTITQPGSSSVAASGTTTFTVVFSPTSLGAKTAQLSLVNGDADENPYIINLTGTGTASVASDIVTDGTFTYATNIDYKNYITADITSANSVELGRFILRDGGATTDADNLSTVLNALSFTVGNSTNLEKLAIYDGAIEVAEVAAAGTTNFTGLTLGAADNETKAFTIRGSFKTIVTDNQRITLTLASATAAATGSGFGTLSATTSTTGTNNVLVVTANRLVFTTQPTTISINVAMPTVVVAATDVNGNVDVDRTGSVAITSDGTLTGAPVTVSLSSGVASFTTLTHTAAGTGRTLSAALTGLTGATSTVFDIITVPNGTYQSTGGGTWPTSGTATWQRMISGTWTNSSAPSASTTDLLMIRNTITTNGAFASSGGVGTQIQVENGGTFNNGHSSTLKSLQVNEGGVYSVNASGAGILANTGTLTVESGGKLILNSSTLTGTSAIWSGVENFKSGSTVELINWDYGASSGANRLIQNPSIISANAAGYAFGKLTIGGAPTALFVAVNGSQTVNLCQNDLTVSTTGSNVSLTNAGAIVTIGGNVIVNSGQLSMAVTTNGYPIINILGNLTATGGNINLNQQTSSNAQITVNLYGDLQTDASRTLSSIDPDSIFNFAGTGDGTTDATTQTINVVNTSTADKILFNTTSGAYVKLINQNFTMGSTSIFTVKSGGVFDFGFIGTTPLTISGPTFVLETGGTIKITSADGIATSGATGNIRTSIRTIATATPFAKFHYVGKTNQATGNALPAIVAELVVTNTGTAPDNVVTLGSALTANTKLQVATGVLDLNEKVTQGTSSTIKIDDAATLRIKGTATFPSGFIIHTLHNSSIVNYAGTNQAVAEILSPSSKYGKLKISGTGAKTLATVDIQVGNTLEVTSSTLAIAQGETLTVTNGITTSNDAISVANGGSLVQVTDENVNVGKLAVTRITQPMNKYDYTYWSSPVSGVTLHDLSPDTHPNRYYSYNPDAVAPALNWSVITGGAGTMAAGQGYIIRAPNNYDPVTYTAYSGIFSGVPNNGTINVGVSGSDTVEKYNLIGNPYPSAISASDFVTANASGTNDILEGTLYFWTHNSPFLDSPTYTYSTGDYASWNGSGSTATNTGGNNTEPDGNIAAGQGFFVQGTVSGSAKFTNDMRIKAKNMTFFKTNPAETAAGVHASATVAPIERSRVWLNLKGGVNGFSQVLVGYIENATNGYDKLYDGKSFGGNSVTFYSINSAKNLVIQGRALPFVDTDEVPMGYKTTLTGNLTIGIDHVDGLFDNQSVYLKDNVLDVVHNLTNSDYVFAAVPGTFNERFVLRYLPAVDLANPTFDEQISHVTIRKNDATLRIHSPYETIAEVLVYDIMGRLVFEKKDLNSNTFEASQIVNSDQTLIVKVKLSNGGVVSKKVL